jgi:hypothetical protein
LFARLANLGINRNAGVWQSAWHRFFYGLRRWMCRALLPPDEPNTAKEHAGSEIVSGSYNNTTERPMLGTILIIILILALLGALPTWGHSRSWGYGPSGGLGLVVIILIVLVLLGRI